MSDYIRPGEYRFSTTEEAILTILECAGVPPFGKLPELISAAIIENLPVLDRFADKRRCDFDRRLMDRLAERAYIRLLDVRENPDARGPRFTRDRGLPIHVFFRALLKRLVAEVRAIDTKHQTIMQVCAAHAAADTSILPASLRPHPGADLYQRQLQKLRKQALERGLAGAAPRDRLVLVLHARFARVG
jgi:hypothetical protein